MDPLPSQLSAPLPSQLSTPLMQSKGPKHKFEGHKKPIRSFVFLHDNVHIVSGSEDGTMRKWDCETGLLVGKPWKGEGGGIRALALSPDRKMIACGRVDGSVQRWDTDGKMIQGFWTGHSWVRSLSWSPIIRRDHIASGSYGTILIRRAENGEVEVGPIETNRGWVSSLAYSPLGDRIASGGWNGTCILDSKTGELRVGPLKDPGSWVTSVVWSQDSSKLYSTSDKLRVFDSISGTELYRFKRDAWNRWMTSIALSPKHNVLACVGEDGVEGVKHLYWVSFSRDGRYLAYAGNDKRITMWMVEDIVPQLAVRTSMPKIEGPIPQETLPESPLSDIGVVRTSQTKLRLEAATQQETRPNSPSLSYLDVDATKPFASMYDGVDPYDNFFQSSQSSLSSASSDPSPKRRLWNIFIPYVLRSPVEESIPLKQCLKRGLFARRTPPNSPSQSSGKSEPTKPTPQGKVRAGGEDEERNEDANLSDCSANIMSGTTKQNSYKGRQEELPAGAETPPPDDVSPLSESDSDDSRKLCKWLMRTRGARKYTISGKNASANMTCDPSPEVVEVSAARGFQRFVAFKRKRKAKSPTLQTDALTTTTYARGSSQVHASSQAVTAPSFQSVTGLDGQLSQPSGDLTSHVSQSSPPNTTTNDIDDDSDSDSIIQGSWNKFLDKICFPCGHYHEDD
ncbi:WD40 repeat-like protein [Rhizopogon vinicolor AM-OR11-026]|uniref:WD40 repeat-like protein n=1 Tax=Rhizopogon vinicolor AM-OR11-026 TaxID=1314800 RepID=A0A1B7MG87_9AGAM|nr:WD40 repeat-like protein [Rhizopogon vinicolor AM-OR11-026]